MFQQPNAEGITIVLVTHDPKVAAYAHRTIRVLDGMVEGDEANPSHSSEIGVEPEPGAARIGAVLLQLLNLQFPGSSPLTCIGKCKPH